MGEVKSVVLQINQLEPGEGPYAYWNLQPIKIPLAAINHLSHLRTVQKIVD